jgi:hypothetical protein
MSEWNSELNPLRPAMCDVGEADVACQVPGEGSPGFLSCYGLGSHIDLAWDLPGVAASWIG